MNQTKDHTVVVPWRVLVAALAMFVASASASAFSPETSPLPEPLLPPAASTDTTATAPLLIYDSHLVAGVDAHVRMRLEERIARERVIVVNDRLVWPQEDAEQAMARENVARMWAYYKAMDQQPFTASTVVFFQTDKTRFIDERHTTSTLEPLVAKYLPPAPPQPKFISFSGREPAQRASTVVRAGRYVIHRFVMQFPGEVTSETQVRFEDTETPAHRDVSGDHFSSNAVKNLIVWPEKYRRMMTAAKRGEMISVPDNYLEFSTDPEGRITKANVMRPEPYGEPNITETILADYIDAHNFPTSITVERRREITPELREKLTSATARGTTQTTSETVMLDDGTTQTTITKIEPTRWEGVGGELGLVSRMTIQLRELRQVDANSDVVRMIPVQEGDKLVNAMSDPVRERRLGPGERGSLDFLTEK